MRERLFNHPVGDGEQCGRYLEAQRLGIDLHRRLWQRLRLVVDTELRHIRDGAGRAMPDAGNNSEG
jgi:hypothetical protein